MTTLLPDESVPPDQVQQGKLLWDKVLQTGYLDTDTYVRSKKQLDFLFAEIQEFLKGEQVKHEDRPNAARSLALLENWLPTRGRKEAREAAAFAFLKQGLSLAAKEINDARQELDPASVQSVIDDALADVAATVEEGGARYVARTGAYSSIYAALLALLLDEITIRDQLEWLRTALDDPHVVGRLAEPVFKPGVLFYTAYYRGQRRDWLPLPKAMRSDGPSKGWIKRIRRWLRETSGDIKFSAGLVRLGFPLPDKIQLEAIRQHYGFPTLLLDLTTNIELAGFFATRNAAPGDTGVIYRYHLAHPYALTVLSSLTARDAKLVDLSCRMMSVATRALQSLKLVTVERVERISRQEGIFAQGMGMWAVHNFLQPVRFRQHADIAYTDDRRKITEDWLLPADDPIERIAAPLVNSLS